MILKLLKVVYQSVVRGPQAVRIF